MSLDIENLEINVKTNAGNASKELGSLSDALERLKGAVKGSFNSKGLSNLASSIADLTNAAQGAGETANVLNAIANALKALSGVGKVSIPSNIGTAITNLATATASIDPDVTQRLNDFASVLINLSNVGQITIPSSLAKQIDAIGASAAAITPEALDSLDRLVSTMSQLGGASMGQGFTESVSDATEQVNALNEAVDGLNGNLEKINGTSISVRNVGTAAKKAAGHAGGLLNSLKRIALYRILRTVLKEIGQAFTEGLKAAYNYSAKMTGEVHRFASSLDSLTSASNQMKGQLGSALAGLIAAVEPFIERLINGFTAAFNVVSQFFAAFTGGTYMKAVRTQSSFGDAASSTASSLNDAADAQKELNRQLMSFDEINKLDDKPSSSSGGNSGGGGGGNNGAADAIKFVTETIPSNIADLVQGFKDFLANVDFGPLETAWNKLTTAGGRLADLLKGALAWGLENVLKPLAKWTIEEAAPAGLDVLSGAINVLSAAAEALAPWVEKIWDGFLKPLAEWTGGVIVSALEGLAGILNGIADAIDKHPTAFSTIVTFIATLLGANAAVGIIAGIAGGIAAFAEGAAGLATALSMASGPLALLEAFAIANPIGLITVAIAAAVTAGVLLYENWDTVCQWAEKLRDTIRDAFGKIRDWIVDKLEAAGRAVAPFNEAVQRVVDATAGLSGEQVFNLVVGLVQDGWTTVSDWAKDKVGKAVEFAAKVANDAATWWSNVKSWWGEKVGAVEKFTTGVKNGASDWWSNVSGWWKGKVGGVEKFSTGVKNEAKTWWSNVSSWWSGKVGKLSVGISIANEAKTWWSNVKKWWGEKVGTLTTKLNFKLPKIIIKWKTVFGNKIPTGLSLKWNAKGAILNDATLFGMAGNTLLGGGEAGREAVLPLDRNTGWMDQLADRLAQRMGGSGSNQPIVVQVTLDGRVVAESSLNQYRGMVREGRDPLAGLV